MLICMNLIIKSLYGQKFTFLYLSLTCRFPAVVCISVDDGSFLVGDISLVELQ